MRASKIIIEVIVTNKERRHGQECHSFASQFSRWGGQGELTVFNTPQGGDPEVLFKCGVRNTGNTDLVYLQVLRAAALALRSEEQDPSRLVYPDAPLLCLVAKVGVV
jgi:hypothetical protein